MWHRCPAGSPARGRLPGRGGGRRTRHGPREREVGADLYIGRHRIRPAFSFDFVISSFVAHGLDTTLRDRLYQEAARIARKAVVIHDYHSRQGLLTEIVEWFEGGDYFNFVESAETEMREAFGELEVIDVGGSKAWYVGRIGAALS